MSDITILHTVPKIPFAGVFYLAQFRPLTVADGYHNSDTLLFLFVRHFRDSSTREN